MKRAGSRAAAIALLVLLVWISYQFILQPARLLQDEMRSRLQNAQALLQRQQLALNKLPTVRARLHRLQELAAGEHGWLRAPSPAQAAAFLQNAVKQAVESQSITVRSVQILPSSEEEGNTRTAVRLDAVMPADALPIFLARLEAMQEPLIQLRNVEIHGLGAGPSPGRNVAPTQSVSLRGDLVAFQQRAAP